MDSETPRRRRRWLRILGKGLLLLGVLYLLLLIPESQTSVSITAGQQAFRWQRDAFWSSLEKEFQQARVEPPEKTAADYRVRLEKLWRQISMLADTKLSPGAHLFDEIETNFFSLAPKAAVVRERDAVSDFLKTYARLRYEVKRQSELWPMESRETRERLYRLLYGGRAAVEEVMLQTPTNLIPPILEGDIESSIRLPGCKMVRGVPICSGDILVSRGGAPTSALIARGNDFPGNFSHVALVYVDDTTQKVSVIESHIECGVTVSSIEKYLGDGKLRIMVLRLRNSPPLMPHLAARQMFEHATRGHIPYDFTMDYQDHSKMFCSEVASAAYEGCLIKLWMGMSHLSTPGVTSWLAALGARHFETQEPSDLEYDPQLRVVAEWRDPETLFKDHADNAVIDVMLEGAERGERLDYNLFKLPLARLTKAYSVVLNWRGKVGPIPEGMSAATALRVQRFNTAHAAIKTRLLEKVEQFKTERGYVPPYWELLRLAREAQKEFPARP